MNRPPRSPKRPAGSLARRSFIIVAIAVFIPAALVALFGVFAYFAGWEYSANLNSGNRSNSYQYENDMYFKEMASLNDVPGRMSAAEKGVLESLIARTHIVRRREAYLSTMADLRATATLPKWALLSLQRRGYAYGNESRPWSAKQASASGTEPPPIVAWRDDSGTVRYYNEADFGVIDQNMTPSIQPIVPLRILVPLAILGSLLIVGVGLLSAFAISRGVVKPVRRVSEASRRVADGALGEPLVPEGPRELRELALTFNEMSSKLARAQEAEQSFLLSVSHELKTPLTSIRGYAEGIGDGAVAPTDAATVIGAETARLERLVGDLLDSARMRKSAFSVRKEQVDLASVARDVAARYEAAARDLGVSLVVKEGEAVAVLGDHDRLVQVVSNLVENALRCSDALGMVTIQVSGAAISVSDTGPGITSDDLPRAFERFYLYTRYGANRKVGTGLGLAIVKQLTEAMNGRVSIASAVGVGSSFTVEMPTANGGQPEVSDGQQ